MSEQKFISKHTSTEIEAMLDKVKQDMQTIQFTQSEINTLLGKIQNMTQPTKTSDLTNDSGFITNVVNDLINYYTKTQTYTKEEVNALISQATSGGFEPVGVLPTENISTSKIYLIPNAAGLANNIKDEYINLDGTSNGWELIGSTALDLSGYVTSANLSLALADYVSSTAFQTTLNDYYTKTEINNLLAGISSGGGSSSSSGANYSLIERQVGTWADGSTIYGKLFTVSELNELEPYRLTGDVITISTQTNDRYKPANAFDGNDSTVFSPENTGSNPMWIGLENCGSFIFDRAELDISYGLQADVMYHIQGFNGTEWEDIATPRIVNKTINTPKTTYTFESITLNAYNSIRVYSETSMATSTSNGYFTQFTEIKFYGRKLVNDVLISRVMKDYTYMEYLKIANAENEENEENT